MKTVTIRPEVMLIDLFELSDAAFAVLARCKVRTLSDWDRLLEKQGWHLAGPAMVLCDLSLYHLDYDECVKAVAVLSDARNREGVAA